MMQLASVCSLAMLTFIAYWETLAADFLNWDDFNYVVHNPLVNSINAETLTGMFGFYEGNWTPLTWLSHALVYQMVGPAPFGHHLVNVTLHCGNTILIFIVATRLFKLAGTIPAINLAAGVAALWFGLHPQHVEAVAWVSARKDVLAVFFALLTVQCYLWYFTAYTAKKRITAYIMTMGCLALALMAKPTVLVLPMMLWLMDVYLLKSPVNQLKYRVLDKIPLLLLSGVVAILAWLAQQQGGALTAVAVLTVTERLTNAAHNIVFYVTKWLVPTAFLPVYPLSREVQSGSIIAVLFITVLCGYAAYKKYWTELSVWLSYVIAILPVAGIVQFGGHAAADRFAYLPTLPFYLVAGAGVARLFKHNSVVVKGGLMLIIVCITVFLFQMTRVQTSIWNNDLTLWQYTVTFSPTNTIAHANLGLAYLHRGDNELALSHYQQALAESAKKRLFYDVGRWYFQMGVAHLRLYHWSEALYYFNVVLAHSLDSGHNPAIVLYYIGFIYVNQQLWIPAKTALTLALTLNPRDERSRELLKRLSE